MSKLLSLLLFSLLWALPVHAGPRHALVVGNGAYSAVDPLANPVADARLMSETLEDVGFEVLLLLDADQSEMKRAIADFGRRLRDAGPSASSLFYYAGHGVQANGVNYLLPVDAEISDRADLDLVGVEASWVLRQMESARNATSLVILDACRDNPFAAQGLRATGLARMDAPTGSFLAYSTSPGAAAYDGAGENSPFTSALARIMTEPGLRIEEVFRRVRVSVLTETGGRQTPWDSSSLLDAFYFAGGPEADLENSPEARFWNTVKEKGDLVDLALFLRTYPDGRYAEEARRRLIDASTEPASSEAPAAPVADQPAVAAPSPPEPAAPSAPGPEEVAMIEAARTSRDAGLYSAYLDAYPGGAFADLAQAEIAALAADPAAALDPDAGGAVAPAPPPVPAAPRLDPESVTFAAPLASESPEIAGRSIREIIAGEPLYAPIEGLPDAAWRGRTCAACHDWTRDALCDQGAFYNAGEGRVEKGLHPIGPDFRRALQLWAAGGCK